MKASLQKFSQNGNSIEFFPDRGGIITSLKIHGKELLYQDMLEETLFDFEKGVRCGIPVLFPQSGTLSQSQQKALGYPSPQHGIIRNQAFEYTIFDDRAELLYKNIRGEIPYDFDLKLIYTLSKNALKIQWEVYNKDTKDFPIAPGFHPYFAVKYKDSILWRVGEKESILVNKNNWKFDGTHRLHAPKGGFEFEIPETGNIKISYDESIRIFWIWSMADKNFVCVEPIAGHEERIVEDPILVKAGKTYTSFIEISLA